MDDAKRIAVVETLTVNNSSQVASPETVIRYQFSNNIESAALELDETAAIISYEEYYPYGETSYRAGRSTEEVSRKRYRYTGKERDEESGLYYYGARYYACWIGRWTAADPIGVGDGVNLYAYCRGNPVKLVDPSGMVATEEELKKQPTIVPLDKASVDRQYQAQINESERTEDLDNISDSQTNAQYVFINPLLQQISACETNVNVETEVEVVTNESKMSRDGKFFTDLYPYEFDSMDEAGKAAIRSINETSISEDLEYSGHIHKIGDKYYYTTPKKGFIDNTGHITQGLIGEKVGWYHTHGGYSCGNYDDEVFAVDDMLKSLKENIPGYLGTPLGGNEVQKFDTTPIVPPSPDDLKPENYWKYLDNPKNYQIKFKD